MAGFGRTETGAATASLTNQLPSVASAGTPYRARAYGNHDLRLRPGITRSDASSLLLVPGQDVVRLSQNGNPLQVEGAGWSTTTSGGTRSAVVGVSAQTDIVQIMPTAFAPAAVLQVRLNSAGLTCSSSTTGSTAAATYQAEYRVSTMMNLLSVVPVQTYGPGCRSAGAVHRPPGAVSLATGPAARWSGGPPPGRTTWVST